MTRPTLRVTPCRQEKSRVALMPTNQSARSRQRAALYSKSYSVEGFKLAKPARMAASSMLLIQRRDTALRHPHS